LKLREGTVWNYTYYPVIFEKEAELLEVKARLEKENIHPRRYFYPSLEALPYIQTDTCPVAKDIASRVLCLPLYDILSKGNLKKIVSKF
jgi:dTDP-4-amino-4,6-dideoxygalactose transaminase